MLLGWREITLSRSGCPRTTIPTALSAFPARDQQQSVHVAIWGVSAPLAFILLYRGRLQG
jgi:hypothetical protein